MLIRLVARGLLSASVALILVAPPGLFAQVSVTAKVNPTDGAEMVLVPAGEFAMGTDASEIPIAARRLFSDAPKHIVNLSEYWIYKNDVTVAQYKAFCKATGHEMPPFPQYTWQGDDHPIVNVNWSDASAYAAWAGVSLPTEAEWEKAARGTDGRAYPWGNEWDPGLCAHWETTFVLGDLGTNMSVGSYPLGASPYGALDMAGNVWQWCADWYDPNYYKATPSINPTGPENGSCRVLRGGAWDDVGTYIFRAAHRNYRFPSSIDVNDTDGFRCAATSAQSMN
ncbi:MAG: SUMF1/EgtB/PvdO family nonheme iron enzyme [Capsulimonadaceae bacterium]|nr:SUMF1/EgtB/PvdO family nonheme iron enzyme [Capsulimonadaceae bacterium]